MSKYTVSCDGIDNYLYDVEKAIRSHSDFATVSGSFPVAPLRRYIYSGRASAGYLQRLFMIRPSTIANVLLAGGSDAEIMDKINSKVWRKRTGESVG